MPTTQIKELYSKNIALIRFLFSLVVNAFTFFGIIVWQWSFFTVIYLYWAEEMVRIIFRFIEKKVELFQNKKISPKNRVISNIELRHQAKATLSMLFPMMIYFVFIIVIVGIIASPNGDVTINNLMTVFFRNTEFNLNLILAVLSEIVVVVFVYKKYIKNNSEIQSEDLEGEEDIEAAFLRKQQEQQAKKYEQGYTNTNQNQPFSTQMIVLHLSIILGTFLYFAANTDKLPIQIDLGAAGQFAFVIVFAAIQTIAEVWSFFKRK